MEETAAEPPRRAALAQRSCAAHPFETHPHRTLLRLSLPVLVSLAAEPLTGLVDTAFVARLGAAPAAALGVGTTLLAGVFWAFSFLGIGTQTEVARALGAGDSARAAEASGLALALSAALGAALALLAWPALDPLVAWMGAAGAVHEDALVYLRIRLLGGPAVLLLLAGFGTLRGVQDMRTPLAIAVGVNLANLVLDPLLIFGPGPFPRLEVAGAAWATTASQWGGALVVVARVRARFGRPARLPLAAAWRLLVTGRDLALRTAALLAFVLLATRAATRAGAEPGAAHQGMRTVWLLTAFLLDAPGVTAQSLVGYFLGAGRVAMARHAAALACGWGLAAGAALAALALLAEGSVARLLVPPDAHAAFASAWWVVALALPVSALAFVTDGIHWGAGDYRFLRNAMLVATALGVCALASVDLSGPRALEGIWLATAGWMALRTLFSMLRIWPGIGRAPLRQA